MMQYRHRPHWNMVTGSEFVYLLADVTADTRPLWTRGKSNALELQIQGPSIFIANVFSFQEFCE